MRKILKLLLYSVLFAGCTIYEHYPRKAAIPILKGKKDISVNASWSLLDVSYAISDHYFLSAGGRWQDRIKYLTIGDYDPAEYFTYSGYIGGGYYINKNKNHGLIQLSGEYGYLFYDYENTSNFEPFRNKVFSGNSISGNLAFIGFHDLGDHFKIGISTSILARQYSGIYYSTKSDIKTSLYQINQPYLFIEPSLFAMAGWKNVRFKFSLDVSHCLNNAYISERIIDGNVSLILNFGKNH